jgi:hypothetical protein
LCLIILHNLPNTTATSVAIHGFQLSRKALNCGAALSRTESTNSLVLDSKHSNEAKSSYHRPPPFNCFQSLDYHPPVSQRPSTQQVRPVSATSGQDPPTVDRHPHPAGSEARDGTSWPLSPSIAKESCDLELRCCGALFNPIALSGSLSPSPSPPAPASGFQGLPEPSPGFYFRHRCGLKLTLVE